MVKLILIVFAIFLIEAQLQTCIATGSAPIKAIRLSSIVALLGQGLYDTNTIFGPILQFDDESLQLVKSMNAELLSDVEDMKTILKNQHSIMYTMTMYIGDIFERAVKYQREIKNGFIDNKETYKQFWKAVTKADGTMSAIHRIIFSAKTLIELRNSLNTDIQAYESFCKTGKSHLQLLDKVLTTLKTITGQFYITKILMFNFLDLNSEPIHNAEKHRFSLQISTSLKEAVDIFKQHMTRASREIWTCDLKNYAGDVRYENNKDSAYTELVLFQRYFAADVNFDTPNREDYDGVCARKATYMQVNDCAPVDNDICPNVRKCNKAVNCKPFFDYHPWIPIYTTHYICLNNNRHATARYQSLVSVEEEEKFVCKDGVKTELWPKSMGPSNADLCDCVCLENDIYISSYPVQAFKHRVVTGIKFTKIDNVLYPQIQEGTLLPSGLINASTLAWKAVEKITTPGPYAIPITLDTEISLSDSNLWDDHVVSGLKFILKNVHQMPRIFLHVDANKIDGRSGIVSKSKRIQTVEYDTELELDLSNRDVPTRSSRPNKLDSSSNQYLKFNMTSLEADGGQTTIPFIDTQEVTANPPLPLARIGLFHRGQPGYGGFLSFKADTIDVSPYVE